MLILMKILKDSGKCSEFKKGAFKKGWDALAHPTFYRRKTVYEKS